MLNWEIDAKPTSSTDSNQLLTSSFTLTERQSVTLVLIGDFSLVQDANGKESLRAAVLSVNNGGKSGQKPNRLTIVNGLPSSSVKIVIEEVGAREISPMTTQEWLELPAGIRASATANGQSLDLPIEFVPPVQNVVIALYERDGELDYVAMPQLSLSDYDEL